MLSLITGACMSIGGNLLTGAGAAHSGYSIPPAPLTVNSLSGRDGASKTLPPSMKNNVDSPSLVPVK